MKKSSTIFKYTTVIFILLPVIIVFSCKDLGLLGVIENRALEYEWKKGDVIYTGDILDENFGRSVAVEGNWAIVGANQHSSWRGAIYFLYKGSGGWVRKTKHTISGGSIGAQFGSAVSISGNYAAASAPYEGGGSVYIYKLDTSSNTWSQIHEITKPGDAPESGDDFGYSIFLNNTTIYISAPSDNHTNGSNNFEGTIFIHGKDTGGTDSWGMINSITSGNISNAEKFGSSISVYRDYVLAGAPGASSDTGSSYLYERAGNNWNFVTALVGTGISPGDEYGNACAISGDTALIAAFKDNIIYVFEYNKGSWIEKAAIQTEDYYDDTDLFGSSLAFSGNLLIVGARDYGEPDDIGAVYFFRKTTYGWLEFPFYTNNTTSNHDYLGYHVALDDNTALVGAINKENYTNYTGSVYFFNYVRKEEK